MEKYLGLIPFLLLVSFAIFSLFKKTNIPPITVEEKKKIREEIDDIMKKLKEEEKQMKYERIKTIWRKIYKFLFPKTKEKIESNQGKESSPEILDYALGKENINEYENYSSYEDQYAETDSILNEINIKYIYHMTHTSNLQGILDHGLLAHNNQYKETDISNLEVNDRRRGAEPIYGRSIHEYVPFYFNPRNAMLYRNQKTFGNDIIILGFSNKLVSADNVIFTEGNAATGSTQFFTDIDELNDNIDWNYVWSNSWYNEPDGNEIKRVMMSEVLVYNKVKSKKLKVIYCQNKWVKNYINDNYYVDDIKVKVNKNLFF